MEVTLDLKLATLNDFLLLDYHKPDGTKVWKMEMGKIYWCKNSKGDIENKNYITNPLTNQKDLGKLLRNNQIYILKDE